MVCFIVSFFFSLSFICRLSSTEIATNKQTIESKVVAVNKHESMMILEQRRPTMMTKNVKNCKKLGLIHNQKKMTMKSKNLINHNNTTTTTTSSTTTALNKSKRIRTIFTPEQLERLENEFEKQQYMVGTGRLYLASTLNLTEAQVKVWFQVSKLFIYLIIYRSILTLSIRD